MKPAKVVNKRTRLPQVKLQQQKKLDGQEKVQLALQLGDHGRTKLTSYPIMELLNYANCEGGISVEHVLLFFPTKSNQPSTHIFSSTNSHLISNSMPDCARGMNPILSIQKLCICARNFNKY